MRTELGSHASTVKELNWVRNYGSRVFDGKALHPSPICWQFSPKHTGRNKLMAKLRVMYWKEIPVQVKAEDGDAELSCLLSQRFQNGLDAISMFDGSSGSDEYLMAFEWGDVVEIDGTVEEAATAVAERYNESFPKDFVARIRELHAEGKRDPRPGAVDWWLDHD